MDGDYFAVGVISGITILVIIMGIIATTAEFTRKGIKDDCNNFGMFKIDNVMYSCQVLNEGKHRQ